jgi:hypothetical protein
MAIQLPERETRLQLPGGSPNMNQQGYVAIGEALRGVGSSIAGLGVDLNALRDKRLEAEKSALKFENDQVLHNYQTVTANTPTTAATQAEADGKGLHEAGIEDMKAKSEAVNARIATLEKAGHHDLAAELQLKANGWNQDLSVKMRADAYNMGVTHDKNFIKTTSEETVNRMSESLAANDLYLQEQIATINSANRLTTEDKNLAIQDLTNQARAYEVAIRNANNPEAMAADLGLPQKPGMVQVPANEDAFFGKQLAFSQHELTGVEVEAGRRLKAATSIEGAVDAALSYERPNPKYANRAGRIENARLVLAGKAPPRAMQARSYYESVGYTPVQASGFVGSLMQESGPNLNPQAHGDKTIPGGSRGIGQWNRERRLAMEAFTGMANIPGGVLQTQASTTSVNPRYASLPLASRQALYTDAIQGQSAAAAALRQAQATQEAATKGSIELHIARGGIFDPEMAVEMGRAGGITDEGTLAELYNKVKSQNQAGREFNAALQNRLGTGGAMDMSNPDIKKGANDAFDIEMGGASYYDGGAGTKTAQNYIQMTGWVPDDVIGDLNATIATLDFSPGKRDKNGNVDTAALHRRLSILGQIDGTPGDLRNHGESKEATDMLTATRQYRGWGVTDPAQRAIDDYLLTKDPERQQAIQAMKETQNYKDAVKRVGDGTTYHREFRLGGLSYKKLAFPNDMAAQGMWNEMYLKELGKKGDADAAAKVANEEFAAIHSPVGKTQDGRTQVMTWAPDKFTPALPDLQHTRGFFEWASGGDTEPPGHNWVVYQAQKVADMALARMDPASRALFDETVMPILVAGPHTEKSATEWKTTIQSEKLDPNDINNGVPLPYYQIALEMKDGEIYYLPDGFRPDAIAAKKDIDKMRHEAQARARGVVKAEETGGGFPRGGGRAGR